MKRDSETDTVITTAAGGDGRVDADHFTLEVDQRTTRVTRIDCGIGLYKFLSHPKIAQSAGLRADNSLSDGSMKSEGTAEGHDPVTDFHFFIVTKSQVGQTFLDINSNHGDVGSVINLDI